MYWSSSHPEFNFSFTSSGTGKDYTVGIPIDTVIECDFSRFFLGYKWTAGLDLFEQIYGRRAKRSKRT